ncbi:MAG: lysophospholipid acyltransferase family protein [Actinomycetes bacterium]
MGFWLRFAVVVLKPLLLLLTRHDWQGREHVPRTGGLVLVTNHTSHVDPLTFAHFVYECGRLPRFLAKSELFGVPFVGRVVRGAGQIAVYRNSPDASRAYRDALDAVRRGECVIVYPEATITHDPLLWPMVGKTGAARIALETGVPVVPVAQWGPHLVLGPYEKVPHLLPRKLVHLRAGPPVDLSAFEGTAVTTEVLRSATERIMLSVTAELETLRGETAPPVPYDVRREGDAAGDERSSA